ncbi:MAG TPA: bifunctional proline dehydrogenase/L-glutamate gamma-semialdehyde dehydrogenase [Acidimicrobiales bacterium]|nr:bifunctional proline dehydrogenase/L-glutamate gamma-semialdehyde dehydrogenase [Acidimicrobiales bacterium]
MAITPAPSSLDDRAVELVRAWLADASGHRTAGAAAQLAKVLKDPGGLSFAVGFIDGVVRPEDPDVAARNLRALAATAPAFLPLPLRTLVRLSGFAAPHAPRLVVPAAVRVLRGMVGHLVVDASDPKLGRTIRRIRTDGIRLNVNLLGEAVLGEREGARRLEGTRRLLARDDVDYVSIKVSSTIAPHAPWAFDETVADVVEHLRPLFRQAASTTPHTFVNLDMEEYKDLDLTIAVLTRLLDEPALLHLEAGIVLQAYLPDARGAMEHLQRWAAARRARGGAGIKVRLVKGANLPMERTDASLHGWPLATWPTKQDTDTHYKQVLEWALTPERTAHVRIGVAGHNLFDVARAWLLAGDRGVRDAVDIEMLLGMAPGQAHAVRRTVGSLLLYTPVVDPSEFDVAIAYLVRRLDEGASTDNFLSAVFDLADSPELFAREKRRFRASSAAVPTLAGGPHRVADRYAEVGRPGPGRFVNTPDTDPSVEANRAWARAVLRRAATSAAGSATIDAARVADPARLDELVATTRAAGEAWGCRSAEQRSSVLHAIGDAIEASRGDLIEAMAAETGKTFDQADPEVSEAVDFAHFYAEQALLLDDVDGAAFEPVALTLVTPPWNFPVAIPAGSTLAALAAGSGVVLKPATPAERCGAVLAGAIHEALVANAIPTEVLALVQVAEEGLGPALVGHPEVDQVILTGAYETAERFGAFRPGLRLLAETSGKNAIIVTPSADLDLAVRDVVASAYGHAGQKCSAASLVVLVGSVGSSTRFRRQLEDAVRSLAVGYPTDAATQMGPVIEPAAGKLLEGLTTLGPGERWILQPTRLDGTGRLWSPGLRDGVQRGSAFHRTEYFGPVLGILRAPTLDEAIEIVNDTDYGLTSGIHSLDPDEIATWLDRIDAGNLYVNRGTTGAIVRRQPFGGWKRSAVGPGAKAGGPDHLLVLGTWRPTPAEHVAAQPSAEVRALLDAAAEHLAPEDLASVRRAASSDAHHWRHTFTATTDEAGLQAERNLFRYRAHPGPITVRCQIGRAADLLRTIVAATTAGVATEVSVAPEVELPAGLRRIVAAAPVVRSLADEDDDGLARRLERTGSRRVRRIGTEPLPSVPADVAVFTGPVTEAGRIELLPFVREQAVSITAHRFGTPDHLTDRIIG